MRTKHQIILDDARKMAHLKDESVDLMITSPPYPLYLILKLWLRPMRREPLLL